MDAELARATDLLKRFTINVHPNGTITLTSKERKKMGFMDLPIEIRNEIHRLLLINPILAERFSVSKHGGFGAYIAYQLSPALFTVSKQTHIEASAILYGETDFSYGSATHIPTNTTT